jgi:hypothetical protein
MALLRAQPSGVVKGGLTDMVNETFPDTLCSPGIGTET